MENKQWLLTALGSACTEAVIALLSKRLLERFKPIVVAWIIIAGAGLTLSPLLWSEWPQLTPTFIAIVAVRVTLDVPSMWCFMRALEKHDVSLVIPLIATTPLFVLIVSFLLRSESPGWLGAGGILLVVVGVYGLGLNGGRSWTEPLRTLRRERTLLLPLATAALWGVTGTLHKMGSLETSPNFYGAFSTVCFAGALTPLALRHKQGSLRELGSRDLTWSILGLAIISGMGLLMRLDALSQASSGIVFAIGNISVLLTALFGRLFLKEAIRQRLMPICLILAGATFITLAPG